MKLRPLMSYGVTLARPIAPDDAAKIVNDARAKRGRGSILIVVANTARSECFEVEASVNDLAPAEVLDALAIASARFGIAYCVPAREVPALGPDDIDALQKLAESLVDRHRSLGWWERVCGRLNFIKSDASFRYTRDSCVRELAHTIAGWRPRGERAEAA